MYDHDDERPIGQSNTLVQKERRAVPWIWEGVVAEEAITLLSAPEKIGKTTLLSLLLDRRRAGGTLLGRTVYPGKTVLCSEENNRLWTLRQPPLDFGPDLLFHRPLSGPPARGRWHRFINDLCNLSAQPDPFDLLVIDTAVSFVPLAERNKRTLRWALEQLSLVADFPAGVLILNQSRNVHRPLAAFADIVMDITVPRPHSPRSAHGTGVVGEGTRPSGTEAGGDGTPRSASGRGSETRRRIFTGVGRYPDTLQSASVELNPEGTDYVLLPDSPAPHPPLLATLQTLLGQSPTPLTRQQLLARWPGDPPRPDTLWRTLLRCVERGLFTISGSGTKNDAFRYGLPSQTTPDERTAGTGKAD